MQRREHGLCLRGLEVSGIEDEAEGHLRVDLLAAELGKDEQRGITRDVPNRLVGPVRFLLHEIIGDPDRKHGEVEVANRRHDPVRHQLGHGVLELSDPLGDRRIAEDVFA